MKCFDTNFLIAYLSGNDDTVAYLDAHADAPMSVPAVSLFEVYRGDVLDHSDREPSATRRGLSWVDEVLPFDEHTALHASELLRDVSERGGTLDPVDAMIAASADRAGATIVTRDEDLLSTPVSEVLLVERY